MRDCRRRARAPAPEHTSSPEILRRFLQEARSAAKLIHPGIVTVFAWAIESTPTAAVWEANKLLGKTPFTDKRKPERGMLQLVLEADGIVDKAILMPLDRSDKQTFVLDAIVAKTDPPDPSGTCRCRHAWEKPTFRQVRRLLYPCPMRLIHVVFIGLGLAACGTDEESDNPQPVARATWYQDVAPIVAQHCMGCHTAGGIAPFALTEYESAVENSARMMHEIDRGAMPPFDAREEADCTPRFGWVDDPRLSNLEKDKLRMWIEDGHALGEKAEIPAPPSTELANVSKTLTPSTPFTTTGTRDQFICYVLDPGATKLEWITGLQVRPDNELVVHHAVITELTKENPMHDTVVGLRGIGQPWNCDNEAQPGDFTINVWTPGNQPMQTAGDIAVPLTAGAKLVMQIHYHPAGQTNAPDATSIDLRYSTTWPQRMYFVAAFGNAFAAPQLLPGDGDNGPPKFMIPANAKNHEEHMRIAVPNLGNLQDVRLFSANPHMHLIGTHISATIERPSARGTDPQNECLANGAWNFDWQRTYQYNAPLDKLPSIAEGDIIDIKCKWDNSIENPFTQRMMKDAGLVAPIDVNLGEQTTNEMCLEIFGVSLQAPPQGAAASFQMPDMGDVLVR